LGAAVIIETNYRASGIQSVDNTNTNLLTKRDVTTFEQVFKAHFKSLHAYAIAILKDEAEAEEIVQQVFFNLWERNENLNIAGPVNAYLYRAVHNASLNYLKHQKVKANHRLYVAYSMKNEVQQPVKKTDAAELEKKIHSALNELPEQCRTIFQMSRFDELKYREIAGKLDLSVKTVENQMGKALRILRIKLAEFLVFLAVILNIRY
jgi:RNA polymerase sigma-70 factor, ECF subfamily